MVLPLVSGSCRATFILLVCICRETELECNKQSGPSEYRPKVGCSGIEKEVLGTLAKFSLACSWSMAVVMANREK